MVCGVTDFDVTVDENKWVIGNEFEGLKAESLPMAGGLGIELEGVVFGAPAIPSLLLSLLLLPSISFAVVIIISIYNTSE